MLAETARGASCITADDPDSRYSARSMTAAARRRLSLGGRGLLSWRKPTPNSPISTLESVTRHRYEYSGSLRTALCTHAKTAPGATVLTGCPLSRLDERSRMLAPEQ